MRNTPITDAIDALADQNYGVDLYMEMLEHARQLEERVAKMQASESVEKDAARYRWLRQIDRCGPWSELLMTPITRTEDIDAAIDAASTP